MSATTAPAFAPDGPDAAAIGVNAPGEAAVDNSAATEEKVRADVATAANDLAASTVRAERAGQIQATAEERLLQANNLPSPLRDRLTATIRAKIDSALDGRAQLPLEECLQLIEESLPDFLRQDRATAARRPHPGGEAFFTGAHEDMSDAQAEAYAREQLRRSGLLRGQRVRIAD